MVKYYAFINFFFFLLFSSGLQAQIQKQAEIWADSVLRTMSIDAKIGQLFMISGYSNRDAKYEEQLVTTIRNYQPGGVIFFQGTVKRQINLTNRVQATSKIPLFIGMDAEHGLGWRLKDGMTFPRMQCIGAVENDTIHRLVGSAIARHLRKVGVHINFAPVVDVNNNAANPVIGMRSYGDHPNLVMKKAHQYARGSHSEKVMPVLKHFPGHGNTNTDSHFALPIIRETRASLDSFELAPYRQLIPLDLPAVMVGHIAVPAIDKTCAPASISAPIVKELLKKELQFKGIAFTDAMNMKGVTEGKQPGVADVEALVAGNDVILFPEDLAIAVKQVKEALKQGILTEDRIDESCRKILYYKKIYQADSFTPIKYEDIKSDLSTPQDQALKRDIYKLSMTLIRNERSTIPFKQLDQAKTACVVVGPKGGATFYNTLCRYANVTHFSIAANATLQQLEVLNQTLVDYNRIIIYNNNANDSYKRNFGYSKTIATLITQHQNKSIVVVQPGTPYGAVSIWDLNPDVILVSYDKSELAQEYAAQALFGGIGCQGVLPVTLSPSLPAGSAIKTTKTRLGYASPEQLHINSHPFETIDSICRRAIALKATPGCQLLIAKSGDIIYQRTFGHEMYDSEKPINDNTLYDIASITKIAATLPAIMQLNDSGKINPNDRLMDYLPNYGVTDKGTIKLSDILLHQAGLCSSIPFFANAIDKKSLKAPLFSARKTQYNTIKIKNRLYLNPHFQYKDSTFSTRPVKDYVAIAPGIYIHPSYQDSIQHAIIKEPLGKPEYRYSDIGFLLLQDVVESVSKQDLDEYCAHHLYNRLGMTHTLFNPLRVFSNRNIAPSANERIYRKCKIHGTVHDPIAALRGGVAGHAGLFSTAEDIAKLMQLYLNEGEYGGERYFSKSIVNTYTHHHLPQNRRAYGFDKPNLITPQAGPASQYATAASFGHTGFTGTIAWADPEYDLIYVFLSNRTYPNEYNTDLLKMNIRTAIQDIIYRTILTH